jgi:hypothetical protein
MTPEPVSLWMLQFPGWVTSRTRTFAEAMDAWWTSCPRLSVRTFTDPHVTSFSDGSYGAWSVQAVNDKLYVTFASLKDLGGGVVDVFDTDGGHMVRFAANSAGSGQGPLQNPWGITQAPANFGAYSNDLLIGNVAGAGNINVFDPATGAYLGQLRQPDGTAIAIKGLWDLGFGDGTPRGGKTNQLFFDAGPNHPGDSTDGLFGVIHAAGDQGDNGGGDQLGRRDHASNLSASTMASPNDWLTLDAISQELDAALFSLGRKRSDGVIGDVL